MNFESAMYQAQVAEMMMNFGATIMIFAGVALFLSFLIPEFADMVSVRTFYKLIALLIIGAAITLIFAFVPDRITVMAGATEQHGIEYMERLIHAMEKQS